MAGKPHQLGNLANLGHNPPPWGLDPYSGGGGGLPVPQNKNKNKNIYYEKYNGLHKNIHNKQ